ncbi:hypothetical protein SAMN05421858_4063 [Haladaptatus litoreus]|uniref:Uncharacterized protein n=1 Tax=Haladaptatus litoreus TaxID=553468 RepID=A0A1N7E6P9_9EURY|nr:hypothetical protein [Haladaptatus litoreus]SIR83668.1 hypothetical protein SAMN05421858_4063 [Haladaptatus litoreus]
MTRVSQEHVIKRWLELETRKSDVPSVDAESLTEREALDELLNAKPGAASFLWREAPIEWREVTLSRHAFERLRVIDGPENLSWRALSPDETVLGAARNVSTGNPDDLTAKTGVDVRQVRSIAENPPDEPLVLVDRRNCRPPRVMDGNYRATARALNLVETGTYDPVSAYVGVPSRPVLKPIRKFVCELVRRRRRRTW